MKSNAPKILIVDNRKELHARAVAVGLSRKGVTNARLHLDELATQDQTVRVDLNDATGQCGDGLSFSLGSDIKSRVILHSFHE
jgi:hypothetical protein